MSESIEIQSKSPTTKNHKMQPEKQQQKHKKVAETQWKTIDCL